LTTHAAAQPKAHRIRRGLAFGPVLIGIVVLAGCGSSSKTTSSASTPEAAASPTPSTSSSSSSSTSAPAAASSSVSVSADPSGQLAFSRTSLSAKAGAIKIDFTNNSSLGHNLTVETSAGGSGAIGTPTFQGGSKSLTLNLKAGTYKFFCSVPGHRQAGMEGTLTVK
jgi:plastocyanin